MIDKDGKKSDNSHNWLFLSKILLNLLLQEREIIDNYQPKNINIYSKIVMNQNVTHFLYSAPRCIGM